MTDPQPALLDQEARDVIRSRFDINLIVEASAGSGKTHSLASRMAAGIAAGVYQVDRMAAVTFTRKAAAELRGRFQLALEDLAKSATGEERRRVDEALSKLDHLFSGTIHAFCARLLRERPIEAGVPPEFDELDEVDDVIFTRRAWADFVARKRETEPSLMADLAEAGLSSKDLDDARKRVLGNVEVEFPPTGPGVDPTAIVKPPLDAAWERLDTFEARVLAVQAPPYGADSTCQVQEHLPRLMRALRTADRTSPAALVRTLSVWESNRKVVLKWWPSSPLAKQVKADTEDLQQFAKVFLGRWRQYVYRLLIGLLVEARTSIRDARLRSGRLNYNDLLDCSARLLRDHPDVRTSLRDRYRWLFVDEFQDTDPLQAEVMTILASDQVGSLRPGALFIVGDPKQSIYRFRRADIEIYNQVKAAVVDGGGQQVSLTTSFRSAPALCAWVNQTFAAKFPAPATPQQPAYSPLQPRPGVAAPAGPVIATLTVPDTVFGSDATADWSASALARWIHQEIATNGRSPSDFLVVTRTKTRLATYASALESVRIPVEVSGAGAFGDSWQVQALASLLSCLADPDDPIALVAVLRGPFYGMSDSSLFEWKQAGGSWLLAAPVPAQLPQVATPVATAFAQLRELLALTRGLPLAAAVERILETTGFLAWAGASIPDGAEAGDLWHAIDRVRRVAQRGGSLAEAVETLEQDMNSNEVESLTLEPGRLQVARVMNVHRAKGLEARVVVLADPLGAFPEKADMRIVRRPGESAQGWFAITKRKTGSGGWSYDEVLGAPSGWDQMKQVELAFTRAEETRALYVAATRAKEQLVVIRKNGISKGPWLSLELTLVGAPELVIPDTVEMPAPITVDLGQTARAAASATRLAAILDATKHSWSVTAATGLGHPSGAPAGSATPNVTSSVVEIALEPGERVREQAQDTGTVVHALLEYAVRRGTATELELHRLARWHAESAENADVGVAVRAVVAAMKTPEWTALVKSGGVLAPEVPFATVDVEGDGHVRVTVGRIDLLKKIGDAVEVIDWKTGETTGAAAAVHAAQLDVYRQAVAAALSTKMP